MAVAVAAADCLLVFDGVCVCVCVCVAAVVVVVAPAAAAAAAAAASFVVVVVVVVDVVVVVNFIIVVVAAMIIVVDNVASFSCSFFNLIWYFFHTVRIYMTLYIRRNCGDDNNKFGNNVKFVNLNSYRPRHGSSFYF